MALLSAATTTMAQNTTIIGGSGSSGVYINEQLIGSVPAYSNGYSYGYGTQNTPSGYPGSNDGEYLSRPGNLLYPPQNYLRSQITIQNFADFQPSGYATQGYNTQGYNAPASAYAPQGYSTGQQQPGLASGSSLYNPYGQPLVPLSQVSQTHVTSTGDHPQYPTQVPAFQPQSQLLVPPPSGRTPVVHAPAPIKTENNQVASNRPLSAPVAIAKVTTPTAPKVIKEAVEPLQITKVPSPVTPPAPVIATITPTQPEPVATAPSPEPSTVTAKIVETPKTVTAKSPEPAPKIETVVSEPILTPPPVPAPVIAETNTGIPSAPTIAEPILVESTEELAPPPTPPAAPVEIAAIDPNAPLQPIKLFFAPDQAELSADARVQLNQLADALLADDAKVIQLLAYASDNESSAQARRVSLSRALAVRGVLMERGIQSTRMHVRALGNKSKDGNPDRVEIIPVQN
ncbi:MAG: OmpA family protein [Halopseudomonas aestusnigri]